MRLLKKYITLGVGHGINDCIAGYIIGSMFYHQFSLIETGLYTLLYNIIAFGGQLVVARFIESLFLPKKYLISSFCFLIASLLVLQVAPILAILFSGIASAVFHVTGGMEASREDNRSFGIGLFASPGVLGLIIGGFLSFQHINFITTGVILCFAYIVFTISSYASSTSYIPTKKQEPAFESHDVIMVILLTAISLRSFTWDVVQMIEKGNYNSLFIIAIAAMCGKIAGGFLADRIGHNRYSLYALILSIPFLSILKKNVISLSIGVFLLQSTIPSTTVMILKLVRSKPAMAIAFSFGTSVFIAILLFYTPVINYLNDNRFSFAALVLAALMILAHNKLVSKKGMIRLL